MKSHFCFLLVILGFSAICNAENNYYETCSVNHLNYQCDPETKEAICTGFWFNYDEEMIIPETLTIPDKVTLTYGVFNPHEVTCKIVGFSFAAFSGCNELKKVSLSGSSLKEMSYSVFSYCENLESVVIENGAKVIGENMFNSCPKLQSVSLPNSIEEICNGAFSECKSLKNVRIPDNIQKIGGYAFGGCDCLQSVTLPRRLQELSVGIFSGNMDVITAHGPKSFNLASLSYIEELNTLEFGDEIEELVAKNELGGTTFSSLGNIHRLEIGDGLKWVNTTFSGTINEIQCNAKEPPVCKNGNNTFSSATYKNAALIVPEESKEKYKNAEGWKKFFERDAELLIDAHKGFISSYKKAVLGVTADGVSQLKIYPEFRDGNFEIASYKLKLLIDGKDVADNKSLTGEFKQYDKLENGKWGFIYTAPKEFLPEEGYKYSITMQLELTNSNGRVVKLQRDIDVSRCGVLLLHGLWGNADCFKELKNFLISQGTYASWQLANVSYENNNSESFHANTHQHKLVQHFFEGLFYKLVGKGYVSSKYDIVGHSMGGILARKYAQEVSADNVNRIITVNTPHSGSEIAYYKDYFLLSLSVFPYGFLIWKGIDNYINKEHPAVNDLDIVSSAIRDLNDATAMKAANGIPVHSISSYMTPAIEIQPITLNLCSPFSGSVTITSYMFESQLKETPSFVYDMYDMLFNGPNDGVVALKSQMGGLTDDANTQLHAPFVPTDGSNSLAHHKKICRWDEAMAKLSKLLSSSKKSNYFADHFSPVPPEALRRDVHKRARINSDVKEVQPSDTTRIKIVAEKDNDNRGLNVHLNTSMDISKRAVFSFVDEEMLLGIDSLDYSFSIPETFEGPLMLYAIGKTEEGSYVADSVVVEYERSAELDYMYFDHENSFIMCVGDTLIPLVLCGWSNGEEKYITPSFNTGSPELLNIKDGSLIALKEGECKLYASYLGQTDSIRVIVMPEAETTDIQNVPIKQDVSFSYNDSQLQVNINDGSSSSVVVNIYDLSGICHVSRIFANDGAASNILNVSSLSPGVYIATARTKNGIKPYKFAK